jgi:exopolyphosphatase/guanosine-5'-triphosphate,3'-diphosphate pyrophosphatase
MIVASIDIGTNTVLLLIAEVDPVTKKINSLRNEQRIPRIGKGLSPGGRISKDSIALLYSMLSEYRDTINQFSCEKILVNATNAFRIASNKEELVRQIKGKFGFDVQIITGEEEGKFAYLGAISDYHEENNTLVIDIGGGSTELISGRGKKILYDKSYPIGVVSGTEKFLLNNPPNDKEISHFNDELLKIFNNLETKIDKPDTSIAIAGTPTTLACIKQGLKEYNEETIEGSYLTLNDLTGLIGELSNLSSEEIKNRHNTVVSGREDILLAGTIILKHILQSLSLVEVKVSTKGIRYGAIINYLLTTR